MAALIRYGLRKSHNFGKKVFATTLLQRCQRSQLYLPCIESTRCLAAVDVYRKDMVLKVHERLDRNLSISTEMFTDLLYYVENQGITAEHAGLLLHLCGTNLSDSSSKNRVQYAERIWRNFEQTALQPSSKLYNMKLKAYMSNGKNISPLDELEAMRTLGINPDKVTYGLLIEGFCRNGDVSGAHHVLEAMNDARLLIETSIFNSFITGHLKAGSPDEATQVLEQLRSRGLTPNSDTYFRFIQHYAEEGDAQSVLKYVTDAENAGLPVDQNTLLKVYTIMLRTGHGNQASQILPRIEKDVFNRGSVTSLTHLVAEGFHKEALDIYLSLPVMVDAIPSKAGTFLIECMILNNKDAKDILEVANKLNEMHPQTTPYDRSIYLAYKLKGHEFGVKLIEEMLLQKQNVRLSHILPAVCGYRDAGDVEGVYKTVDMILSLDPCEDIIYILDKFCHYALQTVGQSDEDILNRLKHHEAKWNTFVMFKELQKNGCAAALECASQKPLDDGYISLLNLNRHVIINRMPKEKESCVKLLTKLVKEHNLDKDFLLHLIRNQIFYSHIDSVHYILDTLQKEGIKLSHFPKHSDISQAPQDVQDKLKALCQGRDGQRSISEGHLSMDELQSKTREELEEYTKKFPRHFSARNALLKKTLASRDLSDIQKQLTEMKAMNFRQSRINLIMIVRVLTSLGDVETASMYLKEIQERFGNEYPDTLSLAMAAAYVKAGNVTDALDMIEIAKTCYQFNPQESVRWRHVSNVLNWAPTMEEVETLHEALVKGESYLKKRDATHAHTCYINKALDSDDDEELLKRLAMVRDRYWVFPCIDKIIKRFINKQDGKALKQVMDLAISVVGNNLFHHKLACGFISCGMPSQAAAVFEKMKTTMSQRLIENCCRNFRENNEVKHIETLAEVVKTLPISRAFMLRQLIEAHIRTDNFDKAIKVLQMHEDEFIIPHSSGLNVMAAYCREHQMQQPELLKDFLSKQTKVDESKSHRGSSSSSSSESDSDSDSSDSDKDSPRHPASPTGGTDTKTS